MHLLTLALLYTTIISGHAGQIPMRSSPGTITISESWDFSSKPSENSTGHLIFNTVSSLLQHWPNTRYRNGHTLVPGSIPQGTLLYYGTHDRAIPTGPDWAATDPEHSYMFCDGGPATGCWHLTLVTTRPLKVLYFDGTSAAKMEDGPMDSQDILLWGEVRPDQVGWEWERIKQLCEWGKKYGVDGYVRMEMNFEIMLCDFTAGLKTVSFLNLISKQPSIVNSTSFDALDRFSKLWANVIESGSWHNRYPGETRIQLDLVRLISFYDTSLAPSLIPYRYGKDRILHRLEGLNRADSAAIGRRLQEAFSSWEGRGSGIDWATLLQVTIKRYADRLEMVQHLLNATSHESQRSRLEQARKIQFYLGTVITPYILHSAFPTNSGDRSVSWAIPVYKHCATTHTAHIADNKELYSRLTRSEHLIYDAVRDTNREICRTVVRMWAEGVLYGLDPAVDTSVAATADDDELEKAFERWKNEIESLMRWLDWSVWLKCKPACSFEELCYLPTWPFLRIGNFSAAGGPTPPDIPRWPNTDDKATWFDPKPRCIQRI